MNALKEVSKVWLVAKMVHTLFESILGNKSLEERLQKAAGKRHLRMNNQQPFPHNLPPAAEPQQQKRKYDDIDFGGYTGGPPVPQVSYERSRPQTPSVTPSRDANQPNAPSLSVPPQSSPTKQQQQPMQQQPQQSYNAIGSRGNTRPTSPFNMGYSGTATPPDLYLVTRNSPPISQQLFENFELHNLFPSGTDMSMPPFSPGNAALDPQLQQMTPQQMQPQPPPQPMMQGNQHQYSNRGMRGSEDGMNMPQNLNVPQQPHMQQQQQQQPWPMQGMGNGIDVTGSPEDTWSNSSNLGGHAVAPTTLNVEDW